MSAFLDLAPEQHTEGVELWQRLTGHTASATRGERDEFLSLVPPEGDEFLRIQRLAEGPSGVHLDVHVPDPQAAAAEAETAGATVVADHGYVVMASPGGFAFCLVSHPAGTRPAPTRWSDRLASIVDQVCLDIPQEHWELETEFWGRLTGKTPYPVSREFHRLPRRRDLPLRFLLQRLDEPTGRVRAHLDLAATDREAETARHERAGAIVEGRHEGWTVLRGPDGFRYCVTDRQPETPVPTGTTAD